MSSVYGMPGRQVDRALFNLMYPMMFTKCVAANVVIDSLNAGIWAINAAVRRDYAVEKMTAAPSDGAASNLFKFFLKISPTRSLHMSVPVNTNVDQIKRMAYFRAGAKYKAALDDHFVMNGRRVLKGSTLIKNCGIESDGTLYLTRRLRGGVGAPQVDLPITASLSPSVFDAATISAAMATDEQSGEATSPTSLLLPPCIQGSSPGMRHVELNEGQYHRFDRISFNLIGCDSRLCLTSFHVSPNGEPVSKKHVTETYQRDVHSAQIYCVTIGDFIGALKASWPRATSRPPIERMVKALSELAYQIDAVLATCKGGDASSPDGTGGDASYLRTGLVRYEPSRTQLYGRKSPFDAGQEGGVKMPGGMPRSTVVSPLLAIIFSYEWQLNTFEEHDRNAVKMGDPVAELAACLDRVVAFGDEGTSLQRCRDLAARVPDAASLARPMPTPKQLVDTFPDKLNSMGQMLLDQLPWAQIIDPDTGRDHNSIPTGARCSIYAEARALKRAAIAAEHARIVECRDNPNASCQEIMTAMLRAAKMSAYAPHETLDAEQQLRLCAVAKDGWHCGDAMPIPKPTSQTAMELPPPGDAYVGIRLHGGEVDIELDIAVTSSAANLNHVMQYLRGENGKPSIPLIESVVPYAFSVQGNAITTTLEDAIAAAMVSTERKIDVQCKPRWALVNLKSEDGQTTGASFRCIPERVDQQKLMHKLNGDLQNNPKLLYSFCVRSTRGNNQVTGTLSDAIDDAARGDDEVVTITYKRDYSSKRLQDAKWAAWERGGKSAPMDEPSMADALPAVNEAAEAADCAALSTELQSKLRALQDTRAPQQNCKKLRSLYTSLYTSMLKLADHDVTDGSFDFDRQAMLKAGSETKADKDAATAALKVVQKIIEGRDENAAKPEVVEHTGRKVKTQGPATIRCSNSAQCIVLVDCLLEAYEAQCARMAVRRKLTRMLPRRVAGISKDHRRL